MKYVAIIGKTSNGYAAHLPDLPGCIALAHAFLGDGLDPLLEELSLELSGR